MSGFDLGPFRAAVARLNSELEAGVTQVLIDTKEEVRRYISTEATFSKKTGSPRLAQAVRARLARKRLAMWVQGVVPRALEFGTREHLIGEPGQLLALKYPEGRRIRIGPVLHPGNPAYQFLGNAAEQAGQPFFFRRMHEMANDAASRF